MENEEKNQVDVYVPTATKLKKKKHDYTAM